MGSALLRRDEEGSVLSKKFLSVMLAGAAMLGALLASCAAAAELGDGKSASVLMMERIETIVYGEPNKGGLVERLNGVERELFGRSLPGSIAERHAAILNFLEVGSEDQPSMLFKVGIAEWILGKRIYAARSALRRIETLETDMDGDLQYGKPLAMRVERILTMLVSDPVTFRLVNLPAGTVLKFRFMEELSPAKSQKGDRVHIALDDDLVLDGSLIAARGCLLDAVVREVKKPRSFGVPGEVRIDFNALLPLGPQPVKVGVGEAARKAAEAANRSKDKGEGAIIGAGAASIAGAALLGPVGLIGGLFVRGNSIRIPEGALTFVQTSGDVTVSAYPIPESLRVDPRTAIRQSVEENSEGERKPDAEPDAERDIIIKKKLIEPSSGSSGGETFELPPEQRIE